MGQRMSSRSAEDLADAIERGDSKKVESLITARSVDVNARLPRVHGPPALVFAVHRSVCCVEIVELLLKAGARIDETDVHGQTACWAAAWFHHVDAMETLIKHRPDLEISDNQHFKTALEVSLVLRYDERIATLLVNAGASLERVDGVTKLCDFAVSSTRALQALLDRGVAVSELRNSTNGTLLHSFVVRDSCDRDSAVVDMLINVGGIDLEAVDLMGSTCTCLAASRQDAAALRCFLRAGGDANSVDQNGLNLLRVVTQYDCAILLLAAGIDVCAHKHFVRKERHFILLVKSTSILPALVAAGAEIDAELLEVLGIDDADKVACARRDIAKERLDFVRHRALQVCIGLQSRGLDALQMCEILLHACGPLAPLIAFHQWWKITTTVKHFHAS